MTFVRKAWSWSNCTALTSWRPGYMLSAPGLTDASETRIAQGIARQYEHDVLVVGHPYVDVWQAVRPQVLGIAQWPDVPRGVDWKHGVCEQLGWLAEPAGVWRAILGKVSTFADLEPSFLGRVEELIDFVTQ